MACGTVRLIIVSSKDDVVTVHLSVFIKLAKGTSMYHKTSQEFAPDANRSMYYTLTPPPYTHADRDQRVIEYTTVADMAVLYDMSHPQPIFDAPPIIPLKYALVSELGHGVPQSCVELLPNMSNVAAFVRRLGYGAIVTRVDAGSDMMEVVCPDPGTSLRFHREYRFTFTFTSQR